MRLALPILLLTATAALAQPVASPLRGDFDTGVGRIDVRSSDAPKADIPAPSGQPFIYDGPGPNSFTPPNPVVIGPTPGQDESAAPRVQSGAPAATPYIDDRRTERLCSFDNPPPCNKPEPPKAPAKSLG